MSRTTVACARSDEVMEGAAIEWNSATRSATRRAVSDLSDKGVRGRGAAGGDGGGGAEDPVWESGFGLKRGREAGRVRSARA